MNRSTDAALKSIHELICAVSQNAAASGGRLFPEFLSSERHSLESESDDIAFDERARFLEPRDARLPVLDAVSLASAEGAGMRGRETKETSPPSDPSGLGRPGEGLYDSEERQSGASIDFVSVEFEGKLAQIAANLGSLADDDFANRNFMGVSEAACFARLLENLRKQIGILKLRAVGAAMHRDAVLAHTNEEKQQHLVDLLGAEVMNSSVQSVCGMVDWHGGSLGEGDERVWPRREHRCAFRLGESISKALWAGTEVKNSLEKIRSNLEAVREARIGVDNARQGYRKLWADVCGFLAAAQAAGFGELELEWISGQKFISLAAIEVLLDAVLADLDWSEKRLTDALLEWEETKAALDQAMRELKAGNLRQAELLQSKIVHRFWLDLDVEAVCRELDAILAKHLAEVQALAARDARAAVSLAERHAEKYSHSPRIRKGFLKFKSSLESEMLLQSSSRQKMTVGLSTLALYGAVAACAFAGGVYWFDLYLQEKASRSETLEKDWIAKISRAQNLDRAKAKKEEAPKSSDPSDPSSDRPDSPGN